MRLSQFTVVILLVSSLLVPCFAETANAPCAKVQHFASGQAPLKYDFQAELGKESSATVTNNHTAALTGLVSELTMPDGAKRVFVWDAYDRNMETASPGASTIQSFPPPRGGLPTAKLLAAVWADGSTYGDEASLQRILEARAIIADGYDRLAKMIESGVQKNWTRDQFIEALDQDQQKAVAAKDLSTEQHRASILPHGALRGMFDGGVMVNGKPAPMVTVAKKAISYCNEQAKLMRSGSRCPE